MNPHLGGSVGVTTGESVQSLPPMFPTARRTGLLLKSSTLKYKQIQNRVARELGVQPSSVKTCWIAEVKRELGLTQRRASNAGQGQGAPPCPPRYRRAIERCIEEVR